MMISFLMRKNEKGNIFKEEKEEVEGKERK